MDRGQETIETEALGLLSASGMPACLLFGAFAEYHLGLKL